MVLKVLLRFVPTVPSGNGNHRGDRTIFLRDRPEVSSARNRGALPEVHILNGMQEALREMNKMGLSGELAAIALVQGRSIALCYRNDVSSSGAPGKAPD